MLGVRGLVHERVHLARVAHLDLDEPAVLERRRVDEVRRVLERAVDLDDLARDRRVDVRRGLDRLDGPEGLALLDLVADLGQVDEDDVAERVRRVVRDADRRDAAVDLGVLVALREGPAVVRRVTSRWRFVTMAALYARLEAGILRLKRLGSRGGRAWFASSGFASRAAGGGLPSCAAPRRSARGVGAPRNAQ